MAKNSNSSKDDQDVAEGTVGDPQAETVGVEMLPGSDGEPVGPEDALGAGPKRGDYRDLVGPPNYQPHQGAEAQRPHTEDIGDAEGKKGGVDTA